jgi:uncharacterized protein YjeT (DUF2065 family)
MPVFQHPVGLLHTAGGAKGGATACTRRASSGMKYFLCVLGMVLIVEGLPYFAVPEKMKAWVMKLAAVPDGSLRRIGLVLMGIGLFLVFLGRP